MGCLKRRWQSSKSLGLCCLRLFLHLTSQPAALGVHQTHGAALLCMAAFWGLCALGGVPRLCGVSRAAVCVFQGNKHLRNAQLAFLDWEGMVYTTFFGCAPTFLGRTPSRWGVLHASPKVHKHLAAPLFWVFGVGGFGSSAG